MVARCVWTFDVAELALKTEIDDFLYVLGLEFGCVNFRVLPLGTIVIDSIEHCREAAAIFNAHAAVGAEAKDPLHFGAEILWVVISGVGRVVSRLICHGSVPSALRFSEPLGSPLLAVPWRPSPAVCNPSRSLRNIPSNRAG